MSEAKPLESITRDVIKASEYVRNIKNEKIKLVKVFLRHEKLISWLRENMQGEVNLSYTSQQGSINLSKLIMSV